jgi:nitroreductase
MSIPRETLEAILRDACAAPSADNVQPWRFAVRDDRIRLLNAGDQAESIFNYRQQVNHASLGACIENLRISAEGKGLRAAVSLFPDPADRLVVAEISLVPDPSARSDLASVIARRASNRKKYLPKEIEQGKIDALAQLAEVSGMRIALVSDNAHVRDLARVISAGEKLALENKSIHDFLFEHVTWTREEDAEKHGFYIDTFEFAPPQKAAFRLFRNWNLLKLFIPLGFPNVVAKDMEKVYATSGALGAILVKEDSPESYVRAGVLFERLWLTAEKEGLALQPTTGLAFFAQPVMAGALFGLSLATASFIRERYAALKASFGAADDEVVALAFRIGYADAPSARTTRFDPAVDYGE